jgi:hypothetical protein
MTLKINENKGRWLMRYFLFLFFLISLKKIHRYSRFLALCTSRHATRIHVSFSRFGESNYSTIAYIRRFEFGRETTTRIELISTSLL